MKLLRRGWRRLLGTLSSRRNERELAAELAFHIEMQAEDNLRMGMAPAEAIRAARLKFGAVESVKESYRDQRGFPLADALVTDLRYAIRGWRKSPGFAITALAAMAVGIGATTSVFSVVNAVLLRPLAVPDPDRMVVLQTTDPDNGGDGASSPARFNHWRSQSAVLHDVSALVNGGAINYSNGGTAEIWQSMAVSADTFRCWGIPILLGRSFTREEDLPNAPRVAVLGQDLWRRRFAGDPWIVGRTISLSGEPHTVIGVAANSAVLREMGDGTSVDVYRPFRIDPNSTDQGVSFIVTARLNPGVTLNQARERLRSSTANYRTRFPDTLGPKEFFSATPLREALVGDVRVLLLVLMVAVVLVLTIACANVANLLLVRAAGRSREIAIRIAIGAGRGRMIRQLLTESVLLSLTGGALGLLLGQSGIRALLAVNTTDLPLLGQNGAGLILDWRVMGFSLAVSLATGIVFGLLPAFQASRADLNANLKDGGGRWGAGLRQNRTRTALIVSEVSLAIVLLVGSALLIRTFVALYKVERGFDAKNVLTLGMSFTGPKYLKTQQVADTIRNGVEHIRALPGVVAAAGTCCVPLQGTYGLDFDVTGLPPTNGPHSGSGGWASASAGFFEAFGIPLMRGRLFTDRDDGKSPPVVIINQTMARKYWKSGNPLKDTMAIGKGVGKRFEADPPRQIIGIVGDVRDEGLNSAPRPMMYLPQAQLPDIENETFFNGPISWVVRTKSEARTLIPAIEKQLRQVTGLPVSDVRSMEEVVSMSTGQQRFNMLLMTVFGCCALLLASIGIYGLMAYTVEQRRQEIGIRLALGARAGQVKRMVVFQGARIALLGVAIGLVAAWGVSRLIESLLFGVKPQDPVVFVAVPAVLTLVALLAVWIPGRRASLVDPAVALRYE